MYVLCICRVHIPSDGCYVIQKNQKLVPNDAVLQPKSSSPNKLFYYITTSHRAKISIAHTQKIHPHPVSQSQKTQTKIHTMRLK